jgi:predicted tellurium resistance membrane protein TerC
MLMLDFVPPPMLWLSLFTLTSLEIILGIDNLIFISIAISRIPEEMQAKARYIGLGLALAMRLILLYAASWLITFTTPIFTLYTQAVSVKDLFMLMGGLFLIVKATNEIHLGISETQKPRNPSFKNFAFVLVQIVLLDLVFSFDSIMTAIGLTPYFSIMAIAVIIAILLMMFASAPLHQFITKYPSLKVLALSFLMLIGTTLVANSVHFEIPHGYVYFAMLFSFGVEILNILTGKRKAKDHARNKLDI